MTSSRLRGVAVVLAFAGMLIGASAASAQGLFRADDLQVFDSTGKQVGTLSSTAVFITNGFDSVEVVFRTGSGSTVLIDVFRDRLGGNSVLYFAEPDCSGPPFVQSSRMVASVLAGPRQTVYVQAGPYAPGPMRGALFPDGQCREMVSHPSEQHAPARRLAIDLADYFTPPFALRATAGEAIPTGAVADALDDTDRIVVFDATGKKVAAADAYAVVTGSGITIPMVGLEPQVHPLYFESTDCSGPAFLSTFLTDEIGGTSVVGPRKTVYLRSEPAQRRRMFSASMFAGAPCSVLTTQVSPTGFVPGRRGDYAAAAPIGIDLLDYFTPPFTARAGRGTPPVPRPD
jgi:hypothetical protein